ncbi:serine/threonine-protein kinase [Streptomyces sp. NBC_01451]|uniref:serine/threonine-protein kinase n=1 Tax=Streptomyces sp. NBC_01451 TaxID=2903872 RepID=UPI002E30561F|nr:protein kinase [Streptomyces sp. NBC_01451]
MSDRPEPEPRRLPSHEQAPAPTRYDRADPRRAGLPAPSTRVEPGRTHRPGDPAPLHLLPTALRDRYEVVGHEDGGAEADILIAVDRGDPDGPRVVVKTYRRQLPHADEIWGHLRGIRHRHLARLLEAGHSDGKQYEVMEWVPGRPLSELIPGQVPARPFPLARVTEAVGQLAEALAILHSRGIVHRDLKAENVILRDGDPDGPLDLVLIDFGLSRLDHDYAFTTFAAGTEHYLAPELLLRGGGTSSPARDWWALGMIVRELLTGVRNFTGYSVHAVYEAVVLRPVQLDAVTDARARLLCRGLLTVDPADRWGAEQIQAWLHGGNPDVVPATARQPELPPLELFGRTFRDGTALALALREPGFWESVAWSLSTPPDNRDSLPLFHWLRGLALTRQSAPGELDRLGDTLVDPALGNDLKVLRLLHWLDPSGQPVWRGRPVGRESLAAVAERAAAGVTEDVRVVDEAWRWRLLPEFARFAGNDSLRGADSTWQAHAAAHPAAVARVLARIPAAHYGPPHGNPPPTGRSTARVLAPLLRLALNPALADSLREELRRVFRTEVSPPPVPLPGTRPEEWQLHHFAPEWYTTVRHGEDTDPVGLGVLRDYVPYAVADAEQERARRHAALAESQRRQLHWAQQEQRRMGGKAEAQWSAAMPVLGYLTLFLVVGILWHEAAGSGPLLTFLVVAGLVTALVQVALEVGLAGDIAGEFGPEYRLFGQVGHHLQRAARASRGLPNGFFALAGISLAVALLPVLWPVIAWTHFQTISRRRTKWDQMYAVERARVLGAP